MLEVIRDLVLTLHAHLRLGPARLSAPLLDTRTLKDRNFLALLERRHRRRQARDTASHNHHVVLLTIDSHHVEAPLSTFDQMS